MSSLLVSLTSLLQNAGHHVIALLSRLYELLPSWISRGSYNEQQLSIIATTTIQLLQDGRWSYLRNQFALPLRFFLTETVLEKGWQMITATTGPIQRIGQPVISGGWFLSAKVPVHFSRANLALIIQMRSSGKLIGLRVSPLFAAGLGQDWKPPPYAELGAEREVELKLGSKLEVPGILCLPKEPGAFPCVIFLSGSGPCDMDSTVGSVKPLKDLALGLAQHGIASIRFDKVTLKHAQKFKNSATITVGDEYLDQANDAIAQAIQHSEIDPNRIFIIGHSLGATVAPYLAQTADRIRGVVLLAAPSQPLHRAYVRQLRYFASLDSEPVEAMQELIAEAEQKADAADSGTTVAKDLPFGLPASYWNSVRELDPVGTSQKLEKPMLLLQGSRDYQVTVEDDWVEWERVLGNKRNACLRVFEGLDHCFIKGEGISTPADYDVPGNVDLEVVRDISRWILDTETGRSAGR
ncbi:hypothetical protein MRS44_002002 [Fusarium solani]|uniref:Alpha/Beta hydrolase protein n=1 Tax=Fusarium solani TaxID=169388 RepID=A0A9P9GAK8_FUSSL|nr:Alpha/Beta hydrolase protein [Fusarium solani]KAH7234202.1 Alpha/Beta hydrolase protein [Fusarium solani]KAJ3471903.1 hypothetical protein MRS44_002002 [Fusarium solani]